MLITYRSLASCFLLSFAITFIAREQILKDGIGNIQHQEGLRRFTWEKAAKKKSLQQHPFTSNDTSSSIPDRFAPIIINVGQGTTGTHLFTEATCLLGYTSLHYNLGCIPSRYITSRNNATSIIRREIPIQIEESFRSGILDKQKKLVRLYGKLRTKPTYNKAYRAQTLKLLEDMILTAKEMYIVLSLHDTPYPFLIPYIIKLTKKHHDGKPPLIILSERDPMEYISRRTNTSHGNSHMMCRQRFLSRNSTINNVSENNNTTDLNVGNNVFDIFGCFEMENEQRNKSSEDTLISMTNAKQEFGIDSVIELYQEYQDSARKLSQFSYNIFNRENRTSTSDLAVWMREKLSHFYPAEDELVNVNLWKMKTIAKII